MKQKTNYKIWLIAFSLVLFVLPNSVLAVTSTGSATVSEDEASNTSTIDNIKKVIQEKKTELSTVGANLRMKRAFLAKVTRVSEETLTITNYAGSRIIPLDEAVIIEKNNKEIKIDEVAIDTWVAIQGDLVDDNLKILKIIAYDKDFTPKQKVISIGSITSLGRNDLKFQARSGENEFNFSLNKDTVYQDVNGEKVAWSDFYEDLQCIVVAFADKNGNYSVSTIRALSSFDK